MVIIHPLRDSSDASPSATPAPRQAARCRQPLATVVAQLVCPGCSQPTPRCSRRSIQTCGPDCTQFHIPPFPWASTSFRPRHTPPTAAATAPPFRSTGHKATAPTAACSASTRPLPLVKPPGFSQSPKAGCKRRCRTRPPADRRLGRMARTFPISSALDSRSAHPSTPR
jgi:hypothetical protein